MIGTNVEKPVAFQTKGLMYLKVEADGLHDAMG
jgi:hypothetical protein